MKTIVILFTLLTVNLFAQESKSKADKLYTQGKYMSAAPLYEQKMKKIIRKNRWEYTAVRATVTFYKIGQYEKALKYGQWCIDHGHKEENLAFIVYDCSKRLGNKEIEKKLLDDYSVKNLVLTQASKRSFELTKLTKSGKVEYGGIDSYVSSDQEYFWITGTEEYRGNQYSLLVDSTGINKANSKYYNSQLTKYKDEFFFTRTIKREGKSTVGIFFGKDLNNLAEISFNSKNYNVGHPCFDEKGTMYFASDMPGGLGGIDLWKSEWNGSNWTDPVNVKEINTCYDESWPKYDSISKQLFFSSNGRFGLGGLDVYVFNFSNKTIRSMESLNSQMDDFCFMRLDELTYCLSSDRSGTDARYLAKTKKINNVLNVLAINEKGENIGTGDNCELFLTDLSTGEMIQLKFVDGHYEAAIKEGVDYILTGSAENHLLEKNLKFNSGFFDNEDPLRKNLSFIEVEYDLLIKTISFDTKEDIPGAKVVLTNLGNNDITTVETDEKGERVVKVVLEGDYAVFAQKKGYLDYHGRVYADKYELIELDMQMIQIKKNIVFKIDNIFYDLNSAELRDSSKIELLKLVEFLKINDNIKVELGSHTDSRSSNKYNQTLSQKRAQSCVDFLVNNGIAADRIIAKGYGETSLVNKCKDGVNCSEEEHQLNRRTEVKILSVE